MRGVKNGVIVSSSSEYTFFKEFSHYNNLIPVFLSFVCLTALYVNNQLLEKQFLLIIVEELDFNDILEMVKMKMFHACKVLKNPHTLSIRPFST